MTWPVMLAWLLRDSALLVNLVIIRLSYSGDDLLFTLVYNPSAEPMIFGNARPGPLCNSRIDDQQSIRKFF